MVTRIPGIALFALVAFSLAAEAQVALREHEPIDHALIGSESFLRHHADLRYRKLAMEEYERGNPSGALRHYRRSARYADKLSQARIAEMLWYGDGIEPDRAMAYVWMDLAAERGYPALVAWREQYWDGLTQAEREWALREGPSIYDEFGNDVAKPRIERELRRGLRAATGSRVGNPQGRNMDVVEVDRSFPDLAGAMQFGKRFRAERFYDPSYWEPESYWQWHDKVFEKALSGEVEIGEIVPAEGKN